MPNPQQTADEQDLGSAPANQIDQSMYIVVTDRIGQTFPLMIQANTSGLTWGSKTGNTLGRCLRLEDRSAPHFYDFGIDHQGNLFITQQGTEDANQPEPALTISPEGSLAFGTSGGPNLTPSPAGGLMLDSSLTVQGFLVVNGVVSFAHSLTVSGGVTFSGNVNVGQLPTNAPADSRPVMIDSQGNLYAQPQ